MNGIVRDPRGNSEISNHQEVGMLAGAVGAKEAFEVRAGSMPNP